MTNWEHAPVVVPLDVRAVQAEIEKLEPDGWELVSMVQIAMATHAAKIDPESGLVVGNSIQPVFLLVFKRPKQSAVELTSAQEEALEGAYG